MSASRMPTFMPSAENPSARLTAVVDLPSPPLPAATAMMASTPGPPGQPRHAVLGAFTNVFPRLDRARVDRNGENPLALAGNPFRQGSGPRQRNAVRRFHGFERRKHLLFGNAHAVHIGTDDFLWQCRHC